MQKQRAHEEATFDDYWNIRTTEPMRGDFEKADLDPKYEHSALRPTGYRHVTALMAWHTRRCLRARSCLRCPRLSSLRRLEAS